MYATRTHTDNTPRAAAKPNSRGPLRAQDVPTDPTEIARLARSLVRQFDLGSGHHRVENNARVAADLMTVVTAIEAHLADQALCLSCGGWQPKGVPCPWHTTEQSSDPFLVRNPHDTYEPPF